VVGDLLIFLRREQANGTTRVGGADHSLHLMVAVNRRSLTRFPESVCSSLRSSAVALPGASQSPQVYCRSEFA
jgi:hypothetical protein